MRVNRAWYASPVLAVFITAWALAGQGFMGSLITDGSGLTSLQQGTTAQDFRVYNTWTSSTNFERADLSWNNEANYFQITTDYGSSGGTPRNLLVGGQSATTDVAVPALYISGWDQYAQASTNTIGGNIILGAGFGRQFMTIVTATGLSGKTFTFNVNQSTVTLTDGTDFTHSGTNSTEAANLAAAINANATLSAQITASAPAAIVYLQPKPSCYQFTFSSNGGTANVTTTSGVNGALQVESVLGGTSRTADIAPPDMYVKAYSAWAQASTNATGGALHLAGGTGRCFYTIVTASSLSGATFTLEVNGVNTTLTDGTDFTHSSVNNTEASNLGAAIQANSIVGPSVTVTTVAAVVYVQPNPTCWGLILSTNGGANATATNGGTSLITVTNVEFPTTYGMAFNECPPVADVLGWGASSAVNVGFSYGGASGLLKLGNGTAGNATGNLSCGGVASDTGTTSGLNLGLTTNGQLRLGSAAVLTWTSGADTASTTTQFIYEGSSSLLFQGGASAELGVLGGIYLPSAAAAAPSWAAAGRITWGSGYVQGSGATIEAPTDITLEIFGNTVTASNNDAACGLILQGGTRSQSYSGTTSDVRLNGATVSGTNLTAGRAVLQGGVATGTGAGGDALVQTSFRGSTGSSNQTLYDRQLHCGKITQSSAPGTSATAINLIQYSTTTDSAIGGQISGIVWIADASHHVSSVHFRQTWAASNRNGAVTAATGTAELVTSDVTTFTGATTTVTTSVSTTNVTLVVTPSWSAGTPTIVQVEWESTVDGTTTGTVQ